MEKVPLTLESAIQILERELPSLKRDFAVRKLAVFGSLARNEFGPKSDVDILVEFEGPARFRSFIGLAEQLEKMLGRRVDLVTKNAIEGIVWETARKNMRHVA